jgi:hypothetical protein
MSTIQEKARERVGAGPIWVAAIAVLALLALAWFLGPGGADMLPMSRDRVPGAYDGAWLSQMLAWLVAIVPIPLPADTLLALVSALALGALLAWLYQRLVFNDWPVIEALLFVLALGANAIIVGTVTSDHRAIPVMLACAAVVPGLRRLESVGDVQAEMSFGLVLAFLLLAGPATAMLIPGLALFGTLSDRATRSDVRAFVAMFLVAIMPTLLVLTGMLGMLGVDRAIPLFRAVYLDPFRPALLDDASRHGLLRVFAITVVPAGLLIAAYWLQLDRRRQPWSALAVLLLPAYLLAGAALFSWPVADTVPTAVFLGAFASWLSVARLNRTFRRAATILVLIGTVVSWEAAGLAPAIPWHQLPARVSQTVASLAP